VDAANAITHLAGILERRMDALLEAARTNTMAPEEGGPIRHCDGCDEWIEGVRLFTITYTNNRQGEAEYCPSCAMLAAMNWNGLTERIKLAAEQPPHLLPERAH
jgi:hypothetical protein